MDNKTNNWILKTKTSIMNKMLECIWFSLSACSDTWLAREHDGLFLVNIVTATVREESTFD